MTRKELASRIDHTVLKAETTSDTIRRVCDEALEFEFCAVCVNPLHVELAARQLADSHIKVASVAGFPLGSHTTAIKVQEALQALEAGASEIDMVLQIGNLLAGELGPVQDDIAAVSEAVHQSSSGNILKVILETAVLSNEHVQAACGCCTRAGADFVKTSTGFHPAGGATVEAVRALKRYAQGMQVKASGGIRDRHTALKMLSAGADRLGCSASVQIVTEVP